MKFDKRHFAPIKSDSESVNRLLANAERDLAIAKEDAIKEVVFDFTYKGLIKTGIALFAHYGYRVSSRQGHHIRIIEKLSDILNNDDVNTIGNVMRSKRNQDFYGEGIFVSDKEAAEYLAYVSAWYAQAKEIISNKKI